MPELAFLVNSELSGGFTATWKTVSSHNKSLFGDFANCGISPNLLEILSCGHQKILLINRYLPDLPVLAISANDVIILISSCS
jgi:hypothetical protein